MQSDTVAVVAFEGIQPFHLSIPCTVFGEDRREAGIPRYRVRVCAAEPCPLRTSQSFSIDTPFGLEHLAGAGTVVVPSWRDPFERAPEALLEALVRAHRRGARIVGLCLGAFVLAQAGLLEGRRATTHWRWAQELAQAFPSIRVDPGVLYVDEGDVLTSAGAAAGLDGCLHLVRRDHGAEVAAALARRLVVAPHRQGGQAQFIEQPLSKDPNDDAFSKALAWALEHLEQALDLDTLARRAHMSRRTFTRHFRAATGSSFLPWLLGHRLALAQRLLESTDLSVDRIAESAGLGSPASLRQQFRKALGISPADYRKNFRGAQGVKGLS